jgi:uncharacterized protein
MKKANPNSLLGLNIVIALSCVGFLRVWDTFDLIERLSLAQIDAITWGVRIAGLSIIAISLTCLIWEVMVSRREGRGKASLQWVRHLIAPFLLVMGLIYGHVTADSPVTYAPPKGAVYACEDVRLPLPGGDVLAGSLTLPKRTGAKIPAVVLITGSSPQDRDNASPQASMTAYRPFRQIAHRLSSNGIAVLRMDDRGVGESTGGDIRQLTTAERAKDIEACIAYLRQRPEIDASRIGLIGLSEGVSISHMIASHDSRIKALVFLSGIGSSGKEVLRYQIQQGVLSEDELSTLLRADKNTRFLYEFDPLITARMIKQPVLIIHGDKDKYVLCTDALHLKEAIEENGNRNVTVRILADYGHALLKEDPDGEVLSARIPDEVLTTIQDWLAREM